MQLSMNAILEDLRHQSPSNFHQGHFPMTGNYKVQLC